MNPSNFTVVFLNAIRMESYRIREDRTLKDNLTEQNRNIMMEGLLSS